MSEDRKQHPPEGLYCRYLRLWGDKRRAEGEQITDNDSEEYWRTRERWHAEQQQIKKAA
jgi:hypothetical protein